MLSYCLRFVATLVFAGLLEALTQAGMGINMATVVSVAISAKTLED
jgi:hypothetical protein